MNITFNEASHSQKVTSLDEAAEIYQRFIRTYMQLECDKRIVGGVVFFGGAIDVSLPITDDGNTIFDLQKKWGSKGRDMRSKLLYLFSSFSSGQRGPTPSKLVSFDGVEFKIPKDDSYPMLISLETRAKYGELQLDGSLDTGDAITANNISRETHIVNHRIVLGIRKYEKNPKHKAKYDSMGKGLSASPMDLNDNEAQSLLNCAIAIDKERTLYAAKDGKCYVFPEHEPGKAIYHGYLEEHPSEKIQRILKLK